MHGNRAAVNPSRTAPRRRRIRAHASPAGGSAVIRLRLQRRAVRPARLRARVVRRLRRASFTPAPARGRRVLRRAAARRHGRGPAPRPAPGVRRACCGRSSSTTTTSSSGSTAIRPSRRRRRERKQRPQPRLGAPQQRRHHLDAGQVGVSVVRGLGPRLPLHPAGARRSPSSPRSSSSCSGASGTSTRTARFRPTSGPSATSTRRCYAWAAWRVYEIDRKQTRHGRHRVPRARLPQADAQLHLVGEPQGRRGQQRLPGRLPRPRQHRRVRPQRAAAHRRLHRAERRHQLDGRVLPQPDDHRARAGAHQPGLRGHRHQVLRALPLHRRRDEQHRRRRHRAVGRGGRVLLRRPAPRPTAAASRSSCARWSA